MCLFVQTGHFSYDDTCDVLQTITQKKGKKQLYE